MKELPVPVPPLDEQQRATDELNSVTEEARRLADKLSRQIGLLTEHRQALVTAAVTGRARHPRTRSVKPDEHSSKTPSLSTSPLRVDISAVSTGPTFPGYPTSIPRSVSTRLSCSLSSLLHRQRSGTSLLGRYGNDPDAAQRGFAKRLANDLDQPGHRRRPPPWGRGPRGEHSAGVLQACPWPHARTSEPYRGQPADRHPPAPLRPRQSGKTLDLALLVNGIPTATAELKNPITGQTIEDAITPVPAGPGPEAT